MKNKKPEYREHENLDLNCLRQELADDAWTNPREFITAFRLRMAIGAARRCGDKACRKHDICARPILDCKLRPQADSYDWDWGWFHCQRKEIYEVSKYEWSKGTTGGSPEFVEAQLQAHRDSYEAFANEEARRKSKT
jgi:hypothetical protein